MSHLAVTVDAAAAMLSVSPNHFRATILPQVATVQVGRSRRVIVQSLAAWIDERASVAAADKAHVRRAPRPSNETADERVARFERVQKGRAS